MVEIVPIEQKSQIPDAFGMIRSFWEALPPLWVWVIIICVTIAGVIIWIILAKLEDERKEKDDVLYEEYKNTVSDCELNADIKRLKNNYSLKNIFFFGIPFFRNEHSAKILTFDGTLIGYYRGHSRRMDGTMNFLAYKNKFLFFERLFTIKVPELYKVPKRDEDGKIVYEDMMGEDGQPLLDSDGKKVQEITLIQKKLNPIQYLGNRDIRILCSHVQKISYFRIPVITDKEGNPLDMRQQIGEAVRNTAYDLLAYRVMQQASRSMDVVANLNPNVKYNQKSPEKTKELKGDEAEL